jgi:hypothetical protein
MPSGSLKENCLKTEKKNHQTHRHEMNKTGNALSAFSFFILCVMLLAGIAPKISAQDFTVDATVSENQIFIGEQFSLDIEVRGSSMRDVSLPSIPDLDGVRVLSSTPSRSTSLSIVNGQTSTTTTYSFTLIAREVGEYTIPSVSIEVGGETYETSPIQIEIIERGGLSQEGRQQLPDIFLEVEVDETNPVPGQQIVASIVLYFKQGIEVSSFQPTAGWRTDGFWKEELQNIRQPQAETVVLDGVRYRSATLMRYALFPSRSGELSLSAFPMNVGVRSQPSRNDPFGSFFGSGSNQRRVSLESKPVRLTVRPLPAVENAISINAVGDLRVERRLSKTEVETGETLELITRVEGSGNIPLVRKPGYNMPDGLEHYTPQESSNVERRGLTIRGDKTFTELISPRAPGRFLLPEERVAVFNPQTRNYRYITLPAIEFEATPSSDAQVASLDYQPMRIQPATGLAVWKNSGDGGSVFGSVWFWLLLVIPAAAFIAALHKRRLMMRLQNDKEFARAHLADEIAAGRFARTREMVDDGNAKEIYNTLHKTVAGYIADKLGLPEAGLSDAELIEEVKNHGIDQDSIKQLKKVLEKCATISYAPTGTRADFRTDIIKTEKLIEELREQF